MTAISSTYCGNYSSSSSSSTLHVTQYHGSYEVTQVGRCASVCIASRAYRSATPWYMVVNYSNSSLHKQTLWLRRVWWMYWFCGWWPKKLYNYSAETTPCLWNSHKNILLNSNLFEIHFTPLFTRRPSIGLPSDYLIKVWSAFLIPSCFPRVLRILSQPLIFVILIIFV